MKQGIHPNYYKDAKITCACGATFLAGSTEKEIRVEICSNCHPFYTGKQKLVDTAGRVDKFKARMEAAAKAKEAKSAPAGQSPLGGAKVKGTPTLQSESRHEVIGKDKKDAASAESGAGTPASEGMRGETKTDK